MAETPGAVIDPNAKPAVDPNAAAVDPNAAPGNILDEAGKEAKAAEEAENKRLLETPDDKLEEADKTKKAALVEKNKAAEAEKAAKEGAPEKYEFTVPEGFVLNQKLVDKFTPLAKELKLPQASAQKLVDMYSAIKAEEATAQAQAFTKFVEDLKAETIKGLGADYKEQLAFAAKTRDRLMKPELVEKLNASGLSNDKDMIDHLITVGKAISEDAMPAGKPGSGAQKTVADILFPSAAKT